ASEAETVIVVLGARAEACRAALDDRPVKIIVNNRWAKGQSTSMQAGLSALPKNISAAVFPLADQPFITAEVIDALIARYRRALAPVVWPEFDGKRGNPVLFDRRLFPEMRRVTGDTGARPVLLAHQAKAERVPVSDAGVLKDVDTPEDLEGA
ncbi:MAG TPA: nucleotidyltransferase family protein, partial [Chloroflexi bacterium]|nr:nucleotidyltransferase family protein [Chloroflexota bacterium]